MILSATSLLVDPPQEALDDGVDPAEASVTLAFEVHGHAYTAVLSYDGLA